MNLTKPENFQDAVVTVMGLGRYTRGGGFETAKWLIRHGAQTVITDLKSEDELRESVDILMAWFSQYRLAHPEATLYQPVFSLGEHRKDDFVNAHCIVENPGVPSAKEFLDEAEKLGVPVESDVSLFFRYFPHPTIAVTGTKGKTTTTLLLGEMLKSLDPQASVTGNVKTSPLQFLDELVARGTPTPVVIELSSWLLETLPPAFKAVGHGPDIAVLTNIYPDHLNRYASFEDYVASKEIIFNAQTADQITILNYDHELVRSLEPKVKGKLYWCATTPLDHAGCYLVDGVLTMRLAGKDETIIPIADVALEGKHNVENILTASCAAYLRGVSVSSIAQVLRTFRGVPDREEVVREVDEITYVNDTTATTPEATMAALKTLGKNKQDVVLIAGGANKSMVFNSLAAEIIRVGKAVILLPGDASDLIEQSLAGKVAVDHAAGMSEAVKQARKIAVRGDIVLLSPASGSAAPFANEFERGEAFREEVRKL